MMRFSTIHAIFFNPHAFLYQVFFILLGHNYLSQGKGFFGFANKSRSAFLVYLGCSDKGVFIRELRLFLGFSRKAIPKRLGFDGGRNAESAFCPNSGSGFGGGTRLPN